MIARKPLNLPMDVVRQFAKDMRAFHAAPNTMERAETAERQLEALQKFLGPRDKTLQLRDVIELFDQMEDLR
jgi:hypothetical protein